MGFAKNLEEYGVIKELTKMKLDPSFKSIGTQNKLKRSIQYEPNTQSSIKKSSVKKNKSKGGLVSFSIKNNVRDVRKWL